VTIPLSVFEEHTKTNPLQDPEIHKATGKTDPVEVMAELRAMKNNFK
jgi:hydroxyacylglutathione hydrolase